MTDKGVYVPGTWIWLPTMLMYGQMFFAAICSLIGAYQAKTVTERHTLLMQALHIVPLFVTGFVRLLLPSNMIVVTPQFNPQIVSEPPAVDRKAFDITVRDKAEAEERDILFALDVALRADAVYMAEHPERSRIVAEELNAVFADGRTDRSFTAKLILSSDELKRYYEEICAAFAGYTGVRKRVSWQHAGFSAGRHSLALVSIKGKTLYLYLALDPSEQAAKYYLKDVSDVKKYNKTPALFRVRSERGLKYAKELIATLAGRFELLPAAEPVRTETAYPKADVSDLIRRGLIRVEGAAASNLAEEEETVVPDETQTIDEPETIDELEVSGEENETDDEAEPAGDERPLTKADIPFSYHVGGPRKANAPEQTEGEKPEEYFGRVRPAGGMALPDVGPMSGEKVDSPDGGRMIRIDQTALSGEAEAAQTRQNMAAAVGQADDQSAEEEMDLSKIHRPQNMDYSRPTTVGVDDVTGFIADIEKEENAEEKKEKEKKKGLFSRIFNKKNGK